MENNSNLKKETDVNLCHGYGIGPPNYWDGLFKAYNKVIIKINEKYPSDEDLVLKWLTNIYDSYIYDTGTVYDDEEINELGDLIDRLEK